MSLADVAMAARNLPLLSVRLRMLRAFDLDVPAGLFVLAATLRGYFVPSSSGYFGVFHAIAISSLVDVFDTDGTWRLSTSFSAPSSI